MKEIPVRKQDDKPPAPPPPPMPPVPPQWDAYPVWPAFKADGVWHIVEGAHKYILRKSTIEGEPGTWVVPADGHVWRLAKRADGIRTTVGGFGSEADARVWAERNPA